MNISSVNLNLLVSFDVLMDERNVTRAARRVGLTQSAMSNALAQLRDLFGDPLLVRGPHGMIPTDRALALIEPVRQGLAQLGAALAPQERFDPRDSTRAFTVAASDHVEHVVLPPLLRRLADEAPGVRVEIQPWALHQVPEALQAGAVDLMIGFYNDLPPGHHEAVLFEEPYVCIVREGHPRVKSKLTLKTYLELSHILVSQQKNSPGSVDRALAKRGLARKVGLRVSHFLLVPFIVAKTDMVAAIGRSIAHSFADLLPLKLLPPPLDLPSGAVGQVWHARTDKDPANAWFRGVVAAVCRDLDSSSRCF